MPIEKRRDVADRKEQGLQPREARVDEARHIEKLGTWLRESEDRYRDIVENTRDWIWAIDVDGRYTYSNHQLEHILGYSVHEFAELPLSQLIHPEDRLEVEARLSSRVAEEWGWEGLVVRFRHKDGSYRYLESNAHPIVDNGGIIRGFRGVDRDITERQKAEDTITEMLERLEALTKAAFDGFAIVADGTYLEVSEHFARNLGYEPEELTGAPVGQTVTPSSLPIIDQNIQKGGNSVYEIMMRRRDGTAFPVEVRATPVTYKGLTARIAAVHDISDRVALAAKLVGIREDERQSIGRDLHDGVGQTLTGVSLGLETLSQKLEREGSIDVQSLRDLTAMVQKTISETRAMARELVPNLGFEGFRGALEVLAAEISEYSKVQIEICCPQEIAFGDDEMVLHLYRLVQEAINNAIRHGSAENIEVRCRHEAGTIHVEVLDDGIGIPAQAKRGQGLGLSNMRQRAQMMAGTLHVTTRREGGTCVRCSYPAPQT